MFGEGKIVIILPLNTATSHTSLKAANLMAEASVLCLQLGSNLAGVDRRVVQVVVVVVEVVVEVVILATSSSRQLGSRPLELCRDSQ